MEKDHIYLLLDKFMLEMYFYISHLLLWYLLRNTFDEYKDQNKQALFCPTKLACFENKSAE